MGWLYAEAGAAAAARSRIGVGDLERRAAEILDIIDRRSADEIEADWVDQQSYAVGLGSDVALLDRIGQGEAISEARAASAVDRQTEHRRLRLTQRNGRDAPGSIW